jgi:zinc protease
VFAVIGPVDLAEIQKVAGELFGDWSTSMTYQRIEAPFKKVDPINIKIETPDKANAQFESGLRFAMSDSDPDYPAMLLAGYMFGGPITSHVSDRIRNREGLSYGANARVAIPAEGNSAMLSATVSLNPVNGPKVEFSYVDELKRTLKDGFTAEEFATSKKAFLDTRTLARAQDAGLLNQIATHELQGRTMQWDAGLEAKIQALTLDQVNSAFRRHVDAAAVSIVKAGDFKAAGVYQ